MPDTKCAWAGRSRGEQGGMPFCAWVLKSVATTTSNPTPLPLSQLTITNTLPLVLLLMTPWKNGFVFAFLPRPFHYLLTPRCHQQTLIISPNNILPLISYLHSITDLPHKQSTIIFNAFKMSSVGKTTSRFPMRVLGTRIPIYATSAEPGQYDEHTI